MDKAVSYIKTKDGLSLIINGKPCVVNSDHVNYEQICRALKTKSYDDIPDLINIGRAISKYVKMMDKTGIHVNYHAGTIDYKGIEIHHTLVDRILTMMKEGFDAKPLVNFLFNLFQNPSEKAIDELYTFLEYGKMPITPDGCFVAYKRVGGDYKSLHDRKTDNKIGTIVSMPRNNVDPDSDITCSRGLHICSFDYLKEYSGDRVIIVKVNPKDVVAIPKDYSNTKARVCEYYVIGELSLDDAGLPPNSLAAKTVYMEDEEHQPWSENDTTQEDSHVTTALETLKQKIADKQRDADPEWYQYGYSCGYIDGKKKHDISDDATLEELIDELKSTGMDEDDLLHPLTQKEVDAINAGYIAGHKDGKGHKKRQFTDLPTLPFMFK